MTAKLFDNALKQGVEHIQCDVSAVLNCKNSSRSKGMWLVGEHPGLTAVWNLLNYTGIKNAHEVRMKIYVFIMWLLYVAYNY